MFERRGRTTSRSGAQRASEVAADTHLPDELPPLRAPGAGHDSGLAAIEAEFSISDADIALLDLGALEFAPQLSQLQIQLAEHAGVLNHFIDRLNAQWSARLASQVEFTPYLMIPERCWEGHHGETLVDVLGLLPTQPWNVLPLAANAATASATGVDAHPGGESLHTRDAAVAFIDEALVKMRSACEHATFTSDTVDGKALEIARSEATNRIQTVARHIAGVALGTDTVDRARATFFGD